MQKNQSGSFAGFRALPGSSSRVEDDADGSTARGMNRSRSGAPIKEGCLEYLCLMHVSLSE